MARLFTVMFVVMFAFAISMPAAYAAAGDTGTTADGFVWKELPGDTIEITGYSGAGGGISVPAAVNSLPVKTIAVNVFKLKNTITSVDIPASVTSIGDSAFSTCTNLSAVTLHSGLKTIGKNAFYNNATLASVDIPASVTVIDNSAFSGCTSLSAVTLQSGLKTIGHSAFYHTSFTSVDIPASVTAIGDNAFSNCTSLSAVTLRSGLETIGNSAFFHTAITSVDIPASVTSIGDNAFSTCISLSAVTLRSGLETIGNSAFYHTALTSVDIPASVTSIGDNAFSTCISLSAVTLRNGLKTIGEGAFYVAAFTNVDIPASVTVIGNNAFSACASLSAVTLHNGLQTIGDGAFYNTALTSVDIPASVTAIGSAAFLYCAGLTKATVRSRSATFETNTFEGTAIGSDGMYGLAGSGAQTYANSNNIPFHLLCIVSYAPNNGTSLEDTFLLSGNTLSAPSGLVWDGHVFGGWYLDADFTQPVTFPMTVTKDTTIYAKWTALALVLSPANGHIYTGGRITITPSVSGGTWSFDSKLLSRDGISFTGLKAGTARVTYTVGEISVFTDIVIAASELPVTGQDFTAAWALGGTGLLAAFAALILLMINRARKRAQ
jgi:uncharacterized repeat protein (TIGR02543 family)